MVRARGLGAVALTLGAIFLAAGIWARGRTGREGSSGPLAQAGLLTGRVTRLGQPVSGATVEVGLLATDDADLWEWGRVPVDGAAERRRFASSLVTVATDESGRFRAENLPSGDYAVHVTPPSGVGAIVYPDVVPAGAHVEADVDLPSGEFRLRGRIARREGGLFRGEALLRLQPDPSFAGDASVALLLVPLSPDSDGAFEVGGLPSGRVSVTVRADDATTATSDEFDFPTPVDFAWTIDADFRRLRIAVVAREGGRPAAGARVRVRGGFGPRAGTWVVSTLGAGPDGRVVAWVPPGPVSVSASAADLLEGNMQVPPDAEEATLALAPAGRVSGRLVDDRGEGVADVVVGRLVRGYSSWQSASPAARSGPDGRFALEAVPPGPVVLGALGPGGMSERLGDVLLGHALPQIVSVEAGRTEEVTLRSTPSRVLNGVVRDPTGAGVSGAVVTMDPLWHGLPGRAAATNSRGAFRVAGLVPGLAYEVAVTAPGFRRWVLDRLTVAQGEEPPLDVLLTPQTTLRVRVIDERTRGPVAGVRVYLGRKSGGLRFRPAEGVAGRRTGLDGIVVLGPIPSTPLGVRLVAPDLEWSDTWDFQPLDVPDPSADPSAPSEPTSVVAVRAARIDGTVALADETPGGWASLTCWEVTADRWDQKTMRAAADERGRFDLRGLRAGRSYRLRAEVAKGGRRHGGELVATAGASGVRLVAGSSAPAAPASVRILDASGRLVPRGTAVVRSKNGTREAYWTDGAVILFDAVPAGPLDVEFREPRDASGLALPLAPLRVTLPEGPRNALEVRLEPGLSISGTVFSSDGESGAAGVVVRAVRVEDGRPTKAWGSEDAECGSGPDGRVVLPGLLDAEYDLHVVSTPPVLPTDPGRLRPTGNDVNVRPKFGVTIDVTVLDPRGEPVEDAEVFVHRESFRPHVSSLHGPQAGYARTDRRGLARVPAVDAALAHSLEVEPPSARGDVAPLLRKDWLPRSEAVTLAQGVSVRGTIRTPKGEPVPGAAFWWRRRDDWEWTSVVADRRGRYEVSRLPATGRLRATATPGPTVKPGRLADRLAPGTPIPADGGVLDLVVDPGRTLEVRIVGPWVPGDGGYALLRAETTPPGERQRVEVPADGRVRFSGLVDGLPYSLWIGPTRGGESVHRTGIRATDGALEVRFARGLSIRGRVENPPGITTRQVTVSGGIVWFFAPVRDDGTFAAEGLPAGTYDLRAWELVPGDDHRTVGARARVQAGATVVLTLR